MVVMQYYTDKMFFCFLREMLNCNVLPNNYFVYKAVYFDFTFSA